MSNPKALVILAEGAEEMETVIIVNILRRGKVDVTLASIAQNDPVTCSRGVKIVADCTLEEALDGGKAQFDAIVLPGKLYYILRINFCAVHCGPILSKCFATSLP